MRVRVTEIEGKHTAAAIPNLYIVGASTEEILRPVYPGEEVELGQISEGSAYVKRLLDLGVLEIVPDGPKADPVVGKRGRGRPPKARDVALPFGGVAVLEEEDEGDEGG